MKGLRSTVNDGRTERLLATGTILAVVAALVMVFASPAQAHHPEIDGGNTCDDANPLIWYFSQSWQQDPNDDGGSGNEEIWIRIQLQGSGSWTKVAEGKYTTANGYEFGGSFDATPYIGQFVRLQAHAEAPFNNGKSQNSHRETDYFEVTNNCVPTTTVPEPTTTVPEPTTTVPEPTTTVPEPTTTVPEPTTTVPEPTTTVPEPTTTEPEVSPTSITSPPTTAEVLPTSITSAPPTTEEIEPVDTLPFTGVESGTPALLALALIGIGALSLVATRRAED